MKMMNVVTKSSRMNLVVESSQVVELAKVLEQSTDVLRYHVCDLNVEDQALYYEQYKRHFPKWSKLRRV